MSIKSRIIFGFGIILALVVLMFFLADSTSQQSKDHVERYATTSELVESISELDQNVLSLQKFVLIFSSNGHQSSVNQANHIKQRLSGNLNDLQHLSQIDKHAQRYEKIVQLYEQYFDTFERAIEDRNKRESLLQELLHIADSIDVIHEQESISVYSTFLVANKHAMRFVQSPDSSEVNAVKEWLGKGLKALETISPSMQAKLRPKMNAYQDNFLQLVQATRGYLFLFNVVMAGQINELARQSEELRNAIVEEQEALVADFRADATQLRVTNLVVALLSLVIGVTTALLIGRSIARPINDMTMTFNKLATGDDNAEVKVDNAAEEIVSMAAAARVFKEKNLETKALLQKTLAAEDQLKTANAELEQFAYVASHDLQEPLRMVASYVQLLGEEYHDKIDEEGHEFIGFASEGAKRMQMLINDLLSLSRVGRTETNREACDLNKLFEVVRRQTAHRMEGRECVLTSDDLPTVQAYRNQIIQVMQNFVTNAIKYSDKERPMTLHVAAEKKFDHWILSFADNGIGIDPAHFDKIFKIFQRLHTRREYEGSGMGLAIVKKIAEQHHGSVWVESKPGKGSCFYFSIGVVDE